MHSLTFGRFAVRKTFDHKASLQGLMLLLAVATLTINATASTVNIQFTTLPTNTENGTYNGFSGGTVDGLSFNNLICNDFSHGTPFSAASLLYTVSTIDDLSLTRFGDLPNAVQNYKDAAMLVYALENLEVVNAILSPNSSVTIGDLQYAIWNIFTPGSGGIKTSQTVLNF